MTVADLSDAVDGIVEAAGAGDFDWALCRSYRLPDTHGDCPAKAAAAVVVQPAHDGEVEHVVKVPAGHVQQHQQWRHNCSRNILSTIPSSTSTPVHLPHTDIVQIY